MIIDCHIHPVISADSNYCRYLDVGDFGRQTETLRRAGIERACGAIIPRQKISAFDQIRKLNDSALQLRDAYPHFYIPGASIDPRYEQESCKEIERLAKAGVKWVGELVGYLFGYGEEYCSPPALTIMQTISKAGMTVNFHCGNLEVVEALAKAMPQLKLVLAHPGDGDNFMRRIELVAKYPNLYLDISGTGIDRYGMLRHAVDKAGKDKMLLGSDYPINNPALYVQAVCFEPLTDAEREGILSANVLRLIG